MKKRIVMISLLVLMIISSLVMPAVLAACEGDTPQYDVTAEIDKTDGVAQGSEVKVYFSLDSFMNFEITNDNPDTDVPSQDGVNALTAFIEYDENVFSDLVITGLNGWSNPTYNTEYNDNGTIRTAIVMDRDDFIHTDHQFLQVTLKVKETAEASTDTEDVTTRVSLKDVKVSNQVNDLSPSNQDTNGEIFSPEIKILPEVVDTTSYVRIMPNMTVAQFKALDLYTECTDFKNANGISLADTDFISTGTTTTNGTETYTIIAVGDINEDGALTITDLSLLKGFIVGLVTTLTDNQKRACDISWDGQLTTLDLSRMKMGIVQLSDFEVDNWKGTGPAVVVPIN